MYLLTKRMLEESKEREDFFRNMLHSDYSFESLFAYRNFLERMIFHGTESEERAIDLGFSLRHLLAAVCLKGNVQNQKILSSVRGNGAFYCRFDQMMFSYLSVLEMAVEKSNDHTVKNRAVILSSGVFLEIQYLGEIPHHITAPFVASQVEKAVTLAAYIPLSAAECGEKFRVWDYLSDRLSPVNLFFQ